MSHHRWYLLALLFLTVGTVVALTVQQHNIDAHHQLAHDACHMALENRRVIRELARSAEADPATPPGIRDDFARIEVELGRLIRQSEECGA